MTSGKPHFQRKSFNFVSPISCYRVLQGPAIEDKDDESKTNHKHMLRVIREAFITSYVLNRLLCECHPELIPHKPAQIAVLLKAVSRLMKAAADTHSQWVNLQHAGRAEP